MPNHITNRLIIKADNQKVEKVIKFLKGKPYDNGSLRYIDFNKIVPIPYYNVWQQEMSGKAEFAKAEQNRKIKIEEAKANLEAEKLNA
jgi:hypothetical protein